VIGVDQYGDRASRSSMRTAADLRRAAFSFRNEGSSVEVADIEGP